MNFNELITKRQSVRKYTDKPVEQEKIVACLEAARLAPSASNSQPWTFVVATDNELRKKIAKASVGPFNSFNNFVKQASVIVAIVMEKSKVIAEMGGRIKKKEYALIDVGIAAEHFCLQAAELNLGTCMVGWFNEQKVMELLKVPNNKSIPLIITVGYTLDDYKQRKKIRKKLDQVVRYNVY